VLIHAAVLLALDAELYARVFRSDVDEIRAGLAPAVGAGADWREIGAAIARRSAGGLGLTPRVQPRPTVDPRYLEPYGQQRWAPTARGRVES
jgi:hypothetical protein